MIRKPCWEWRRGKKKPITKPTSGSTNAHTQPIGTQADIGCCSSTDGSAGGACSVT